MTETGLAIKDKFDWAEFVDKYWDRRPVLYTRLPSAPFVPNDVFAAATRACHPTAGDSLPVGVQLTIEDRQPLSAEDRLPQVSDGDLSRYGERMTRHLAGAGHALIVNVVHAHDFSLWRRERDFFAPLWERVGLPSTGAITTLFHGDYEHSPVGVHKDRFATFMYVLSGHKRMRMWAERPWDHDATTVVDYDQHRECSIAADVAAGQLLYWPASYFHVGENLGTGTATSVNVGIPREHHNAQYDLQELIGDLTPDALVEPRPHLLDRLPLVSAELHTQGADSAGTLHHSVPGAVSEADQLLQKTFTDHWDGDRRAELVLARYSAGGFTPAPTETSLPELEQIALDPIDPHRPPLWCRRDTGALVALHGHVIRTIVAPAVLAELVEWWRTGSPARPLELADRLSVASADRTELLDLLYRLAALRAFRTPPSLSSTTAR